MYRNFNAKHGIMLDSTNLPKNSCTASEFGQLVKESHEFHDVLLLDSAVFASGPSAEISSSLLWQQQCWGLYSCLGPRKVGFELFLRYIFRQSSCFSTWALIPIFRDNWYFQFWILSRILWWKLALTVGSYAPMLLLC